MPNWCYSNITITSHDKPACKKLNGLLDEWGNKDYTENGFGGMWLGNILGNSGVDEMTADGDFHYRCRGTLCDHEYSEDADSAWIHLNTETAWGPMLQMWVQICKKYLPDAEITYSAEESGCGVYVTNDPDLKGKYYLDIWDPISGSAGDYEESDDALNEDELNDVLNGILGYDCPIDTLIQDFQNRYGEQAALHQWETLELEECQ